MAVRHGYGKSAGADALVFAYDTGDTRNSYRGRPTTNFYSDGHFPNGTDMVSEGGSNPTNEIVEIRNPGLSKYALKQTMGSAYTEYQINLSTELQASTTYCLSGWYAESLDYVGASRMFHCRAYSATSAHTALDTGLYNVVRTQVIDGITWKYCYATITTPADYSNTFHWYVGYSSGTYTGARYYTNLMMEQGTYPSQYVAGTRSATQGLLDLTGNSAIDLSNVSFDSNVQIDFDGTNDYINLGDNSLFDLTDGVGTVEAVIKFPSSWTAGSQYPNIISKGASAGWDTDGWALFGFRDWGGAKSWGFGMRNGATARITSRTNCAADVYLHVVATIDGTNIKLYENGTLFTTNSQTINPADNNTNVYIGRDPSSQYFPGDIPVAKIYNRALTAAEVKNNYNNYKGRFNI